MSAVVVSGKSVELELVVASGVDTTGHASEPRDGIGA